MKNKEYSKTYLKQKEDRLELPNNYQFSRFFLLKDFVKSRELYMAIAFFFSVQLVIATIAAGEIYPNLAGAMNLLAILLGIVTVVLAVIVINKRQRVDDTRRKFKLSRVLLIVSTMLIALFAFTALYNFIGIAPVKQANQASLDSLLVLFPVAMIFTIIVVSPVTEEIVFRELFPFATGPSYVSFVFASLMFIALHAPAGIMGFTSYAILATGFLYARLKDNNVYTAIGVHVIWNAITIII